MITVNQLEAISCRLFTPWTGAWTADVDVTLDDTGVVPTGLVALTIGASVFAGTVDDRASGKYGETAKLRIVAGAGGWDKDVAEQPFHNDAVLLSTEVLSATAAEVGETVLEAEPLDIGVDYIRLAGPAGRVLRGRQWYVNPVGVTVVGPRLEVPADPDSVSVIGWDPLTQRAELASDDVVPPGTIVTDDKFGTVTLRDVEQNFTASGSQVSAWCSSSSSTRLAAAFAKLAKEATGAGYSRPYAFRVVEQSPIDGRVLLQAVDPAAGAPDMGPIAFMPGIPGATAKLTPSSVVAVCFLGGDPTLPKVFAFDGALPPIELALTAAGTLKLTAPIIQLNGAVAATAIAVAGGIRPVAAAGPVFDALSAVGTALTAISAATVPATSAAAATANQAIQTAMSAPPTQVLA